MRRLRATALRRGDQVRKRHRVAQLLAFARSRRRDEDRSELVDGPDRSALREVRWPPRSRVRRWSGTDRAAILYERRRAELRAEDVMRQEPNSSMQRTIWIAAIALSVGYVW